MGNIRLTAETKQEIEEAKNAYIELKSIALALEGKTAISSTMDASREAKERAFEAYTAFTHTLRKAFGPSWSIAGSPENEAYRRVLRQVETSVSNASHQGGHLGEKRSQQYLARRDNLAPGGRNGVAGRDS